MNFMENDHDLMIGQTVVDAKALLVVQNGIFHPSVDYHVRVKIMEGNFNKTMLPVIQFPVDGPGIMERMLWYSQVLFKQRPMIISQHRINHSDCSV